MPIVPSTKTICGHQYTVIPFNFRKGLSLQRRLFPLVKSAAAGIMEIAPGLMKKGADSEIPPGLLGSAIEKIGLALCECDIDNIIPELLSYTTRDHADLSIEVNQDEAFRGNMAEMYQVIWYILVVNDFFGLSATMKGGTMAGLLQKMQGLQASGDSAKK